MKRKTAKRKPGRPSTYSGAVGLDICEGLIAGRPLNRILAPKGMPKPRTVLIWLEEHPEFTHNYARARAMWAQIEATGIIRLADTATDKNANAVRVKVDTRKWVISRLLPKVYGDKLHLEDETVQKDPPDLLEVARSMAWVLQAGVQEAEARGIARLPAPAPSSTQQSDSAAVAGESTTWPPSTAQSTKQEPESDYPRDPRPPVVVDAKVVRMRQEQVDQEDHDGLLSVEAERTEIRRGSPERRFPAVITGSRYRR